MRQLEDEATFTVQRFIATSIFLYFCRPRRPAPFFFLSELSSAGSCLLTRCLLPAWQTAPFAIDAISRIF